MYRLFSLCLREESLKNEGFNVVFLDIENITDKCY